MTALVVSNVPGQTKVLVSGTAVASSDTLTQSDVGLNGVDAGRLASAHGFTVAREQATTLRVEEARPVVGILYVLQRS